jgi:hypothetical protein
MTQSKMEPPKYVPNFEEIVKEIWLRCDGICEGLKRSDKDANFPVLFAQEILENAHHLKANFLKIRP